MHSCQKLTGMQFKLETDHKPLIAIFSRKNLDDLSPRLQRIKLRMMKFSYTIVHIPGKELFAADALSRNPQKVPYKRENLEAEIDVFIQVITSSLPASSRRLEELRTAQLRDETCRKFTDYCCNFGGRCSRIKIPNGTRYPSQTAHIIHKTSVWSLNPSMISRTSFRCI